MDTYKLMDLINNVYKRAKYQSLDSQEEKEIYEFLLNYADGDFEEREDD